MANTLRFKRGLVSGIPIALAGEPLFTTDTFDLYIGNGTTNTRFQKYIASGTTSQLLRGDGSLLTMPIVLTSPSSGQVLKYNGTSWVNDSDAGITGSGAAGQVAYFTGATTQGGSNNLFWDATNVRLGIGTNTPTTTLDIQRSGLNILKLNGGTGTNQGSSLYIQNGNFCVGDIASILGGTPNTAFGFYLPSAPLVFYVGGTLERMRLDTSGNLGLGVTPSAWRSTERAFQIGLSGSISAISNAMKMSANVYADSSNNNIYINSSFATFYLQNLGQHQWWNAPSGTAGGTISFTQAMTLTANGRLLLGTTTEGTQRLQVTGDTLLKGSGNTSATTALTVQNSSSQNAFRILNNGQINLGNNASSPIFRTVTEASVSVQDIAGTKLLFVSQDTETGSNPSFHFSSNSLLHTSGNLTFAQFSRDFIPTSGTGTVTTLRISGSINQTGGANGITRGLYVNPTLTAAADWRSIETSNNTGWSYYGAGTANSYFGGSVGIGATSLTGYTIRIGRTMTGSTSVFGIGNYGAIQSGVTSSATYYDSYASTQSANFGLTEIRHFNVSSSGTFANVTAGGSVTNQFGFYVDSSITGATNNYGYFSNIASGTGRWNLYMGGTAANYINGNTIMGTLAADSGEKLQVNGTMKVTGASTFGGAMTLAINQNSGTIFTAQNTTAGTNSYSQLVVRSDASAGAGGFIKHSASYTAYKINTPSSTSIYNGTAGDIVLLNDVAAGQIKMAAGASSTAHFTIANTGAATFSSSVTANDSCTITRSQNGNTKLTITNINTGGNASAFTEYNNASSGALYGKRGSAASTYKILTPHDAILYNYTEGNISILNDFATGTIKMTAGGASNAHLTIAASGSATFSNAATFQSTITTTQLNLSALNTAPANSTDTGTLGEIRIDANYIYVCTATNTWKRVAIATF
jgi:hypothetical protein